MRKSVLAALPIIVVMAICVPGLAEAGTLTDAELHALVSQMSPADEVAMVHGEGDPPGSAAANASCAQAAVGCVGEAGWIPGVARLASRRCA
jgi:hypothetical protein